MFTSRAEYRILLRQDDADVRLTPIGYELGLVNEERYKLLNDKIAQRDSLIDFCKNYSLKPSYINDRLVELGTTPLKQGMKLRELVLRPQIHLRDLVQSIPALSNALDSIDEDRRLEILEASEILIKYSGYIDRERILAEKLSRLDKLNIDGKFDYLSVHNLSIEARQKLDKINPKTIGQASRISGVSPADINVLLILLGK
jgi:tRNA uridine 5-carboxymethylaminomethyl modification enzyme